MFGLSPAVLQLFRQLGVYLQQAIHRAATHVEPDPDQIAEWLVQEMATWEPELKGRKLSDPETKKAAARFLSGVACNLIIPSPEATK